MNRNSNRIFVNKNLGRMSARVIAQKMNLPDMCYVQYIHDLIEVLAKHNIVYDMDENEFISKCFVKLINTRETIFEYSKHVTTLEYERCIPNLIRKLDSKIAAAVANGEQYKVSEFVRGNLLMDDMDKKNTSADEEQIQIVENSYEVCILCSNQQVITKDGYKQCLCCSGIYK